jgi:predicted nucleic acid-binding protein
MDRLIVDASVAIAWVHPGQATLETSALLGRVEQGTSLVVPAFWPVEVANALLVLERRGKLTAGERSIALEALLGLDDQIDHEMSSRALTRLSQLAAEMKLSAYDAAYLELALRLKLPLACRDGPLRVAAKKRRVAAVP